MYHWYWTYSVLMGDGVTRDVVHMISHAGRDVATDWGVGRSIHALPDKVYGKVAHR